jgi:predicted  nucleic acid-binding Zn-ribbon protein
MVKLFQLKVSNRWSDCSFRDLLTLLKDMLPQGNAIPETIYKAKQIICPLGLKVEKIHSCKNNCILYHGPEYEDLEKCPTCGLEGFNHRKDDDDNENCNRNRRKGRSKKVFWYFPLIPRLKRWFENKKESELLRWHKEKHKQDAKMIRHPADTTQWQNIDSQNPEFVIDLSYIRITMSSDGMNPFMNSSTHSTWRTS